MIRPPIFIVGVQRSGTTLLAAMLASHSRLSCGPETHFFRKLAAVPSDALCAPESWPHEAVHFVSSITHTNFNGESDKTTTLLQKYGLSREQVENFLRNRDPGIPAILASVVEPYMRVLGKQRWVEKTPDHISFLDRIRKSFPDSPIIRIVRDPRDTALSMMQVPWGAKTFLEALLYWKRLDGAGDAFIRNDQFSHTLRYEDLIRTPREELEKLCRFIGEDFEEQMLDTSVTGKQVNSRDVPWKAKASQPVDSSRDKVWLRSLSKAENMLAEAFLGDRMKAYGYETVEEFPYMGELYPEAVEMPRYEEPLKRLVSTGIRFWKVQSDETVSAEIYLGNPGTSGWFAGKHAKRIMETASMAGKIIGAAVSGKKQYWIPDPSFSRWTGAVSLLFTLLLLPRKASVGRD